METQLQNKSEVTEHFRSQYLQSYETVMFRTNLHGDRNHQAILLTEA